MKNILNQGDNNMMVVDNKFEIGDFVYLVTDVDQSKRMVTGFTVRQGGHVIYELSLGTSTSWHIEQEITKEKNILV